MRCSRGEMDWWEQPTADLLPLLKRNRNVKVETYDPTGLLGLCRFNHLHPPFDNPAIRRALLGAISQADYMTAVIGTDPEHVEGQGRLLPARHALRLRCRHRPADRAARLRQGQGRPGRRRLQGREGGADGRDRLPVA